MKKYFKDLDVETKIDIILNNDTLYNKVCEEYYEYEMENQYNEGELMLGDSKNNGIEIRDHYSSFYLVLKDWNKFLDNLDADYLCPDGLDLHKEIMKLKEEHDNIDIVENEDRFNELEEELEEKCKELLSICERQLHEYENYTKEDVADYIRYGLEECGDYEDYYIIDDDYKKVYYDVSYTETFE